MDSKASAPVEQNFYPTPGPPQNMYPQVPYPDQHYAPANPPPYEATQPLNPPKPGFVAPDQQPQIVQVVTLPQVGPNPVNTCCPSCRQQVMTRLEYASSGKTHLFAGLLCLFICWPCFWVPYCMDSCKNANHYCTNCGAYIGTYKN